LIVGYSVAERPQARERPIWFGGGTLASDLKLGALREEWMDSPHLAAEAAAEWNAAARNNRKVSGADPENATPPADMWVEYTRNATALVEKLRVLPRDDHATWAKAAREVSGAFAAWSYRLEQTPGPLAATAAELSRTAQLRAPRQHSKPVALPSIAGTAMLFMAASSKNKTAAQSALMLQLVNTAFAIHEMHQQSGRIREAQRLRSVVTEQLKPFAATMPEPVLVGAPEQAAGGQTRCRSPWSSVFAAWPLSARGRLCRPPQLQRKLISTPGASPGLCSTANESHQVQGGTP
jgi:hypothetical protein